MLDCPAPRHLNSHAMVVRGAAPILTDTDVVSPSSFELSASQATLGMTESVKRNI